MKKKKERKELVKRKNERKLQFCNYNWWLNGFDGSNNSIFFSVRSVPNFPSYSLTWQVNDFNWSLHGGTAASSGKCRLSYPSTPRLKKIKKESGHYCGNKKKRRKTFTLQFPRNICNIRAKQKKKKQSVYKQKDFFVCVIRFILFFFWGAIK